MKSALWMGCLSVGLAAAGCGGGTSSGSTGAADAGPDAAPLPATLAVTADWLHHTLSLVDYDALVSGASDGGASPVDASSSAPASGRVGMIGLSQYAQGPYTVKITPDGATAIVTLSSGFFAVPGGNLLVNATIPTGPSKVRFVDLASRTVEAALDTGDGPTGIAITHDGSRAFVAHEGASTLSVLDVKAHKVLTQVDLGGTFAEEVSIDDSDTVGIVTYLDPTTSSKNVRTFAVADMAATLSPPVPLGSDAAGVPFFPGSKTAYVVLAYNPLTSPTSGYALIDATNPSAPVKVAEQKWTDATYVDYQAIAAPARGTVLVPVSTGGMLSVREYALGASDVELRNTFPVAPTMAIAGGACGAGVDGAGRMVLTMPADRQVAVLDLSTGNAYRVPWFSQAGPLGIALR